MCWLIMCINLGVSDEDLCLSGGGLKLTDGDSVCDTFPIFMFWFVREMLREFKVRSRNRSFIS